MTFAEGRRLLLMLESLPLPEKVRAQARRFDVFLTVLGEDMAGRDEDAKI